MATPGCDLLVITPHTDDAEIALGGTSCVLADRGRAVWVCDLTRGELATNADPDERWREAERASEILGLRGRVQLTLPDGYVSAADHDQVAAVVWVLRCLRPRWVVTAPEARRHPDHLAVPDLVSRAVFLASLRTLEAAAPTARWWGVRPETEVAPTWAPEVLGETCPEGEQPDLYVDISAVWARKIAAFDCYASQFQRAAGRHTTPINDPGFRVWIDDCARRWGRLAGVERAEALRLRARPVVTDLPTGRWA